VVKRLLKGSPRGTHRISARTEPLGDRVLGRLLIEGASARLVAEVEGLTFVFTRRRRGAIDLHLTDRTNGIPTVVVVMPVRVLVLVLVVVVTQ
jgi:hypothetical protein